MGYMKDTVIEIGVLYKQGNSLEYIASYMNLPIEQVEAAIDILMDDPDFRDEGDLDEPLDADDYFTDNMDGDFDSGMASAGYGTDEDYGADFYDGEFV
jgi:hypothetical protein